MPRCQRRCSEGWNGGPAPFHVADEGRSYAPRERCDGTASVTRALPKEEFPDGIGGKYPIALGSQLPAGIANEGLRFCTDCGVPPLPSFPLWHYGWDGRQGMARGMAAAQPGQRRASEPVTGGGIYSGALNLICSHEHCIERWWFFY